MNSHISQSQVRHVGELAHIPVSEKEEKELVAAFEETLSVIDNLESLDTSNTEPTHQVTGLHNVWRDDVVTKETMFTQEQAVANAPHHHQGFFVVDRIIDND